MFWHFNRISCFIPYIKKFILHENLKNFITTDNLLNNPFLNGKGPTSEYNSALPERRPPHDGIPTQVFEPRLAVYQYNSNPNFREETSKNYYFIYNENPFLATPISRPQENVPPGRIKKTYFVHARPLFLLCFGLRLWCNKILIPLNCMTLQMHRYIRLYEAHCTFKISFQHLTHTPQSIITWTFGYLLRSLLYYSQFELLLFLYTLS